MIGGKLMNSVDDEKNMMVFIYIPFIEELVKLCIIIIEQKRLNGVIHLQNRDCDPFFGSGRKNTAKKN